MPTLFMGMPQIDLAAAKAGAKPVAASETGGADGSAWNAADAGR